MNWISSLFLRAKHWQIFSLLCGMMLLAQISMFSSMQSVTSQDFGKSLAPFWGLTLLSMFCFNAWFWAMGSFLNSIVQPSIRPGAGLFRFAIIYPILYMPIFIISFPQQPATLAVILPLHLLAMLCMFYLLNFVSKNLVLAETHRAVRFYDYAGPFFLLWFFPIGVWAVQPRINRLYAARNRGEELSGVPVS
jgi:hypothetical protein